MIENIVHEQFLKLGMLYERSKAPQIDLLTACSGTDAPALALQMFEESAHRLNMTFPQSHKMSCEIEAFKQAYIQNNFDPIIYPDIAKLTTTIDENDKQIDPRDIFGIETKLPEGNFFVAGTVCKNFSMMRGSYRIDIEDKGQSGETFLAAVGVLEQQMPQWTLFENVTGAPWDKMSGENENGLAIWDPYIQTSSYPLIASLDALHPQSTSRAACPYTLSRTPSRSSR